MNVPFSEFGYIAWLRRRCGDRPPMGLGIGDDTAVLSWPGDRPCLVTTDMILEHVHFEPSTPLELVGRKALAVNLSDIAAMAGRPVAAVVALGVPRDRSGAEVEELSEGICRLAGEFQVAIVGGDTNRSSSGVIVCITLLGEVAGRGPVLRSGARPGDWIVATGSFGGSLSGKHLRFTPRVAEAIALHDRFGLHAMIDVTDGLAADVGHIAEESRCRCILFPHRIPLSDAAREAGGALTPEEHALYDGEDFELVFTLDRDTARKLIEEQPLAVPLTHIGRVESGAGVWLEEANGSRRRLEPRGYDHFRS